MNIKRRNLAATAAIMRKGGVHDKTNKAKRQKQKQDLKKNIRAECQYKHLGSFFWQLRNVGINDRMLFF